MSTDPSKTSGQMESSKGSIKETLGGLTGSTNLEQTGKKEHAKGETETNQARAQGVVEGTKERVAGAKDTLMGALKGDETKRAEGEVRREAGSTQQDVNL